MQLLMFLGVVISVLAVFLSMLDPHIAWAALGVCGGLIWGVSGVLIVLKERES